MNRLDWENPIHKIQRNMDPNSQGNNSMGHTSGNNNDWDTLHNYPSYPVADTQGSMEVNVGWEPLGALSQNAQNKQSSEEENPDGEPLEMDFEDPELSRKRKQLKEIEEKILRKKVTLALKKVEPFVKNTTAGFSSNEKSAGETLRERVNVILHQRQSLTFISKVKSSKERTKSSWLRKRGLLQEHHPLKQRVKTLMKQRYTEPCVLPTTTEVFNVTQPSPSQSFSLPAKEENSANKGFQRFLSVLNKGVDMDLLSRIVNDDSEDLSLSEELLNIPVGTKPNPHSRSESPQTNIGTFLPAISPTSSVESKIKPISREKSKNERLSLPDEEQEKPDRRDSSFSSSSRLKSPSAVNKQEKDHKENPKLDEQSEQLQNILKTLGLNLEVEEMSKLADRTQERLYGKKHEGRNNRREQESEDRASQRHYTKSPSTSSSSSHCSSSSSRSTSYSRDSKPRLECKRSRSRDRSRGRPKTQVSNEESVESQRLKGRDEKDFTYQHPLNQTYSHHDNFSSFPDDRLSQYSASTTFHSGTCNTNTHPYWTYSQGTIPTPFNSSGLPNQQNEYHHFSGSKSVYSHPKNSEDMNLFLNPDLSTSEGQTGSASGLRCLQVIKTTQSVPTGLSQRTSCLKQLTKTRKRSKRKARKKRCNLFKERKILERIEKKQQKMRENQIKESVQTLGVSLDNEAEKSEDLKQQLTEEEIKANLRKKLEAFNQKVKQKLPQPSTSQLLESVECQDYL